MRGLLTGSARGSSGRLSIHRDEEGVAPIIGVLLLVALTILLSAILLSSLQPVLPEKPPFTAAVEGRLTIGHEIGMGTTSQFVELYHRAGDPVPVRDMELVVMVHRGGNMLRYERISGFPVTRFGLATTEGDDLTDKSALGEARLGALHPNRDGIWGAGDTIGFRIKTGGGGITLLPGDTVQVRIVHIPSQLIIVDQSMRVFPKQG
ncbi:flagellin-like protein [Methanocalculus alkaliphilus]|uniref:type IV pilin n=1 Tax=Methanocalculus alkaliphilus TaxID=768730 RepID=UPI00209F9D9D|nr:type IV pilin [Methanocalculus alkaliphilus]MCP1715839.1 flagellin-like protein [Methanocalculus alkaliphilus]